jgi:hypothetical protein
VSICNFRPAPVGQRAIYEVNSMGRIDPMSLLPASAVFVIDETIPPGAGGDAGGIFQATLPKRRN